MKVYSRRFEFSFQGNKYINVNENQKSETINLLSDLWHYIKNVTQDEFSTVFWHSHNNQLNYVITSLNEFELNFRDLSKTGEVGRDGNKLDQLSRYLIGAKPTLNPISDSIANTKLKIQEIIFSKEFLNRFFPQTQNPKYNLIREELIKQYSNTKLSYKVINLLKAPILKSHLYFLYDNDALEETDEEITDLIAYIFQLNHTNRQRQIGQLRDLIAWMKKQKF